MENYPPFEEIVAEFHREKLPELFTRELDVPANLEKAITIVGLRKSGKTYYFYQLIHNLMAKGAEKSRIFYINFDDERLEGTSAKDLSKIVELYHKINPDYAEGGHLFLDEIQNVTGWEKFVRRLLEKKKFRIFLTGSSSKLMSKEIATSLRGSTLSFNLFTLSFREFLGAKGLTTPPLTESERGVVKRHLDEFLKWGGFPELPKYDDAVKIRTLKEYLDLIIYKDIAERYGIKRISALKFIVRTMTKNFARELSVRKLYNFLVSSNVSLSKSKVYEYVSCLEDINFVFLVRKYGGGLREVEGSTPKAYIADLGFATLQGAEDAGRRMENAVAVELLRRKHYFSPLLEISYYKDYSGREVDFVVKEGAKIGQLIQVCYDTGDFMTKERELKALAIASEELKCNNLLVITWDYENEENFGGKAVRYLPLWKWLLMSASEVYSSTAKKTTVFKRWMNWPSRKGF